jgi:sortase A
LFLLGGGLLLYPTLSSAKYRGGVAEIKQEFLKDKGSQAEREPASERLYEKLKEENQRLFETNQADLIDAFSYEQPGVDLSEYGIKDNLIGFIAIEAIGVELPIYLGANTEQLKKGAVHLTQTSYPVGGENTNTVIAAHRGNKVPMFRNIHKIKIGDTVTITNFREVITYHAAELKFIAPAQIDEIKIQSGRELLTLLSCDPLGLNYRRIVVVCERVMAK